MQWLFDVCKKTVFALAAFVHNNVENQKILFKNLSLLRTKMGQGLFVWDVVISVFEGNQNLCEVCPADLFLQFANMLESSNKNVRFLEFFLNSIQPVTDGRSITRNQNITLSTIADPKFQNTLVVEFEEGVTQESLNFHIKSLKVLAFCAKNRNSNTGAKCQNLVSLQTVSKELQMACQKLDGKVDKVLLNEFKTALIQFAHFVYVDTPLVENELAESKELWSLLVLASKLVKETWKAIELKRAAQNGEMPVVTSDEKELVLSSLTFLHSFFGTMFNDQMTGQRIIKAKDIIKNDMNYVTKSKLSVAGGRGGEFVVACTNFCDKILCRVVGEEDSKENRGHFRPGGATEKATATATATAAKEEGEGNSYDYDEVEGEGMEMKNREYVKLMAEDKQLHLTKMMQLLAESDDVQSALAKKDNEFLERLEDVENLTDPENPEWVEALTGFKLNKEDHNSQKTPKVEVLLNFLLGKSVLFFILTLVAIAAAATILQMTLDDDVPLLMGIEFVISSFFMIELVLRVGAYMKVHGELDR